MVPECVEGGHQLPWCLTWPGRLEGMIYFYLNRQYVRGVVMVNFQDLKMQQTILTNTKLKKNLYQLTIIMGFEINQRLQTLGQKQVWNRIFSQSSVIPVVHKSSLQCT
jgi:hypothetical protein